MWLLIGDNDGRLIYLKPNTTMIVGRNKGDIILSDDGSISRIHAQIIVKPMLELDKITDKTQPLSLCTIKDPGSKYGNYIIKENDEGTRIIDEELHHMDKIRFGLQNYIFTVHYIPVITATSGMSINEKEKLEKLIEQIDGKISYAWTDLCTYMTVEKPTISEKLSCALASQTPIVSMLYWNEFAKSFADNKKLPDPKDFVDSIDDNFREIRGKSVSPNIGRKTLFENLIFVHFNTKQYATYSRMIKLAGGKSLQYGRQRINPDVSEENVIVVQLVESNTTQATGTGDSQYASTCEKLSQLRRRTIPESEIPVAILHCSIEKYCNPRFDYATLFTNRREANVSEIGTVLALDTQDISLPATRNSQRVRTTDNCIPETINESCNVECNVKNNTSRKNIIIPETAEISFAAPSNFETEAINKNPSKRICETDDAENERNKKICLKNKSILSIDREKNNYNVISESPEYSICNEQSSFSRDAEKSVEKKDSETKKLAKPNISSFFTKNEKKQEKSSILSFFDKAKEFENKQQKSSILNFFDKEKESENKQEKPKSISSFFEKKVTEKKREPECIADSSDDEKIEKEKLKTDYFDEFEERKIVKRSQKSSSPDAIRKPWKNSKLESAKIADSSDDEKIEKEKLKPHFDEFEGRKIVNRPEKSSSPDAIYNPPKKSKLESANRAGNDNIADSSDDEKIDKEKLKRDYFNEFEERKIVKRPQKSSSSDAIDKPWKKNKLESANLGRNDESPKSRNFTDSTSERRLKNVIKEEKNAWINDKIERSELPDNQDKSMFVFLRMDTCQRSEKNNDERVNKRFTKQTIRFSSRITVDNLPLSTTLTSTDSPTKESVYGKKGSSAKISPFKKPRSGKTLGF